MSDQDPATTERRRDDEAGEGTEPEQRDPGGDARPDKEREERPYHDGV